MGPGKRYDPRTLFALSRRLLCLLLLTAAGGAACVGLRMDPSRPLAEPFRVLLLGDSISIGYTQPVRELLAGRATVIRPTLADGRPENCQGTTKGVAQLERWLELDGGGFGVIHVNFGLHDLKRVNNSTPNDPPQASPEVYGAQLRTILSRLCATGARVVFATTTPIPGGELRPYRAPGDSRIYNQVALEVAAELDVAVNDLYGFAIAQHPSLLQPGNVHFDQQGSRLLAERVVASIL